MRDRLAKQISAVCNDLFSHEAEVELTRPDEQFGDYATNAALKMSKKIGQNPRQIAEAVCEKLNQSNDEYIQEASVAGPGFINIKLTDKALAESVGQNPSQPLAGKTVVAEYSDPNPFKVLHAGHLYTTIVGDSIASLAEKAGAKVHRVNFGGDVGLHVGKAMWAIIKHLGGEYPEQLESIKPKNRAEWVSHRYVEGNSAYEENESAKQEIVETNKKVYQLHNEADKNSPFAQIYWTCRQWSYEGFNDLYDKLQVNPFEKYYPESQTAGKGLELARQALEKGVLKNSQNAVVYQGEEQGLHTRVFINSEGLPTYEAKDLGLAAAKWQDYKPDINIIITANDIVEYMKVVLEVAKSFYSEIAERTTHLTHGMIKLAGGQKMSSRKGNILKADDILEAAKEAAGDSDYHTVLAAVKYSFLKNRLGGDIVYDPGESVALEGNSGPYLQYAHARARSIIRKSEHKPTALTDFKPAERSLARKISEYCEVVEKATAEMMPHYICTYLYELAQTFNSFYENNRVIGDERESQRLSLVELYAETLKDGLSALNIEAPDSM